MSEGFVILMSFRFFQTVLAAVALLVFPLATGQASVIRSQHVAAELIFESTSFTPGQAREVILRLSMDPGWHTYWKNPGDSGQAPRIRWKLPNGFTAADIRWPTPVRISTPPLMTYGYENEVDLLTGLRVDANVRPGQYKARVEANWLECADICLPGKAAWDVKFTVTRDAAGASADGRASLFVNARRLLPAAPLATSRSAFVRDETLFVPVDTSEGGWLDEYYFFEASGELTEHAAAQKVVREGGASFVAVPMNPNAPATAFVDGVVVRADWFGETFAREISAPLQSRPASAASGGESIGVAGAVLFSFLGGLLLNLMPCVFPVLSLKVFSFLRHAGSSTRSRLFSSLAYTGGILISFWALAAVLLLLRGGGEAVGWGFQLQSPLFVFGLAVALFLFALNLLGVFEFNVSMTGLNAGEDNDGYGGSFFSGVLAVIVATPCTAPFMGAALGFALTQSALVSLLVFTALGLGLAAPFLLLTFVPGLARVLPRPGDWMVTLKQFMGFLMLATVLWLVWLFGKQTQVDAVAILLAAFLLTGIAAWVLGRWNQPTLSGMTRWIARGSAAGLVAFAVLAGIGASSRLGLNGDQGASVSPEAPAASGSRSHTNASDPDAVLAHLAGIRATAPDQVYWAEWSPELVAGLRARGVPIFVDFTADWCLSCKVNERVALNSPRIWKAIHAAGIVPVKADWTNENEAIGRAIADYGRSGIPLYVLYDRDGSSRFLPEVLTEGIVLDALDTLR